MRNTALWSLLMFFSLGLVASPMNGLYENEDKTPKEIIEDYIQAVGGLDNINDIKTIVTVMEAEIQGMAIEMSTSRDITNRRMMQQTVMNGNVMQKTVVKGDQGYMTAMGQRQDLEGDQLEAVKTNLFVFPELQYESLGFSLEMGESAEINGEEAYMILVSTNEGFESKEYFSVVSGLKLKVSSEMAGDIEFSDYQEVEGVMFPMTISISNPMLPVPMESRVISIEINESLDASLFE